MDEIVFRLPGYFKDKMILQQHVVNRVFGQTRPNSTLRIILERFPAEHHDQERKDVDYGVVFEDTEDTEADGFFETKLPPIEASFDYYRLTLSVDDQQCVLDNIYFGEVWLALGESNMAMPARLTDVSEQLEAVSKISHLHVYTMAESGLPKGETHYLYHPTAKVAEGHWLTSAQTELSEISAIALSFAVNLRTELKVPVGIYNLAANDTMLTSWLPRRAIEEQTSIKNHLREVHHFRDESNWNELPPPEKREKRTVRAKIGAKDDAAQILPFTRRNQPGVMFNHKIAPFSGLAIRGAIMAHGESDVQYPDYYLTAFKCFAEMLKQHFKGLGEGPCLIYSQVPPHFCSSIDDKRLAYFNEILTISRRQLVLPAGMVTLYDLPLDYPKLESVWGRPLNPKAKAEVGRRMCSLALGLAYHLESPKSAPEVKFAEWIGNKLMLSFEHTGDGLFLPDGDLTLKGFTICDEEFHYIPAEAKQLYGVRTLVWHPEITDPASCSYAFSTFNQQANLFGGDRMPVVPFRLERDHPSSAAHYLWMLCDQLTGWMVPDTDVRYYKLDESRWPGYFPLWSVFDGRGEFRLEKDNKRTSSASLYLTYRKADEKPLAFGPELNYASLYPPLDLSDWQYLTIDVFNPDHHVKNIRLLLDDSNGLSDQSPQIAISDLLAWQQITFIISDMSIDLKRLIKLQFLIKDPQAQGGLFIDSVRCHGRRF